MSTSSQPSAATYSPLYGNAFALAYHTGSFERGDSTVYTDRTSDTISTTRDRDAPYYPAIEAHQLPLRAFARSYT